MRQTGVVSLQMAHLTENELPRLKTKVKALSEEVQELKTDISQARYVIELCPFIITGNECIQNDSKFGLLFSAIASNIVFMNWK